MKRIAILGSTGSIGCSTLNIAAAYPDRFQIVSLAAGSNLERAYEQCLRWHPKVVSVATERGAILLSERLDKTAVAHIEVVYGAEGTVKVATLPEVDFVVSAIVGVAGLQATFAAVRAGKTIGLANKECLVAAGELITAEARRQGKPLLPIDSEHNAIHQCMRGGRLDEVRRVWLTASGGPFLNKPQSEFCNITVSQALNHPTWKMGRRITIDSATLMNKGFEVIEACRLFNLPPAQVEVRIHPQSTIHSMVEFVDGSTLAQISMTDMRLPILYALTYPDRIEADLKLNLHELSRLEFQPPDTRKFPCLRLAYEAAEAGGARTVALNAADEVAVAAFLEEKISFEEIASTIERVLRETETRKPESIEEVLTMDARARHFAEEVVADTTRSRVVPGPAMLAH